MALYKCGAGSEISSMSLGTVTSISGGNPFTCEPDTWYLIEPRGSLNESFALSGIVGEYSYVMTVNGTGAPGIVKSAPGSTSITHTGNIAVLDYRKIDIQY